MNMTGCPKGMNINIVFVTNLQQLDQTGVNVVTLLWKENINKFHILVHTLGVSQMWIPFWK